MKFITPVTFLNAMLTANNISTASDPAAWSNVTAYTIGQQAQYSNQIYQAKTANTNKQPDLNPNDWSSIGPINTYAMFDRRISSVTTNPGGTITLTLVVGAQLTDMSFLAVTANTITLSQTDPTDGVVYTETQTLVFGVSDYDEYCFDPIVSNTAAIFSGFQPYLTAPIDITIENGTDPVICGACIFGYALVLPESVQYGAQDGIKDYSDVEEDAFGVRDIVERDYADDAEFDLFVDTADSPEFVRQLKTRRAQATLILAVESRPDTQYWGLVYYKRTLQYFDSDVFALTVKGLT